MVGTFEQPLTGAPFGPGFWVALNSDFIGPLPTGSFWRINLFAAGGAEEFIRSDVIPTFTNAYAGVWGHDTFGPRQMPYARSHLADGLSVNLTATLESPTAVLDSATQTAVWDTRSGLPYVIQQLQQQPAPVDLVLQEQIQAIDNAVHMGFPGLPRIPLVDFFPGPIVTPTTRELVTPDRSLEGTLERPGGIFDVNAFGLEWEVVSFPPGNGVVQGAPDRWARRVLDLQLVGTDAAANEYTRSFESYVVDHYRVLFNPVGLTRIHYWIEPGTTIRFYWLLLGV